MPCGIAAFWGVHGPLGHQVYVCNPDGSLEELPSKRPLPRAVESRHEWGREGDREAGFRLAYDVLCYVWDARTAVKLQAEFYFKVIRRLDHEWWFDVDHVERWAETVRHNQEEREVLS